MDSAARWDQARADRGVRRPECRLPDDGGLQFPLAADGPDSHTADAGAGAAGSAVSMVGGELDRGIPGGDVVHDREADCAGRTGDWPEIDGAQTGAAGIACAAAVPATH